MDSTQRQTANSLWMGSCGVRERRRGAFWRHSGNRFAHDIEVLLGQNVPLFDEPIQQMGRDDRTLGMRGDENDVGLVQVVDPLFVPQKMVMHPGQQSF